MRIPNTRFATGIPAAVLTISLVTAAADLPAIDQQSRPARHRVEIRQFEFVPDHVTVSPGDTVVWINRDIVPHTVTAADEHWDSNDLAPNEEWEFVVPDGLRGGYFCRYHSSMQAVLTTVPRR